MAHTLQIQESEPDEYPTVVIALGIPTEDFLPSVWQRLEAWIGWRWGERDATFIVEGPGEWTAPLQPFSTVTLEIWHDDEWVTAVVPPTPTGGYRLDCVGPFRFTGIAGTDDPPPAAVKEAYRRLATYFSETINSRATDGALRRIANHEGVAVDLQSNWSARALQYSGAADLLRPYRQLGAN